MMYDITSAYSRQNDLGVPFVRHDGGISALAVRIFQIGWATVAD